MDNNILRNSLTTVFEPHIDPDRQSPFIYHMNQTQGKRVRNFHENLELLYILKGCGSVETDGTTYPVQQGDLVVINSYAVHQVDSQSPIQFFCLIVDSGFCKYHGIDISRVHFTEHLRDPRLAPLFHRAMDACFTKRPFSSTALHVSVLEILLLLCDEFSRKKAPQFPENETSQKRVQSAIAYIKRNISKKLAIGEIASAVGVSQYHFMREFKRSTGCTITNYINIIRCELAKELLQAGKHKVREVGLLCGFESESYFCNVFKKHTGMVPSDFICSEK